MPYLGNTPTTQSFISGTDYFSGNGSTTAFTLTRTVASVNDIEAVVNNVVQRPNDAYTISGTTITFTSAPSSGTDNIYVRYLSTTTQSITPSQNTVAYSTLNTDLQSGGYASNFKNRIINGAMTIDQRNNGASVSTTSGVSVYTLDRWMAEYSQTSKYTVQQDAGAVTPPVGFVDYLGITSSSAYSIASGDYFDLQHKIEGFNIADLGWGTANAAPVTLSFWVRSSLTGTFGGTLRNAAVTRTYPFTYTISASNTWEQKTVTIAGDTSGTWTINNGVGIVVAFGLGVGSTFSTTAGAWAAGNFVSATGATSVVGTSGATFYITGVQLEKGSTATSFDYRPYGTELALCQRYYLKDAPNVAFGVFCPAYAESSTSARLLYKFPAPMRTSPTALEQTGTASDYAVRFGQGVTTCGSVPSFISATIYGSSITFTVASGLTTGQAGDGRMPNAVNGFLAWSAEL
jgi:hypothetical protein